MKKIITILLAVVLVTVMLTGCEETDVMRQQEVAKSLEQAQPTPTDIEYSLERYNLSRRAYWVNGMEEKARSLECPIEKPLGYIVLFLEGVGVVDTCIVDGKVSSLNSFLTPDSQFVSSGTWLADVDGSYGENDNGIFFFTSTGEYREWTGAYYYSSEPVIVKDPILKVQEEN